MQKAYKQGCWWGCGLMTLVLVAVVGTGTWYAVKMTTDFRAVKDSEQELWSEVKADSSYVGDLEHPPQPERVAAFLAVQRGLHERRLGLERAVTDFEAAGGVKKGGPLGFFKGMRAASELAPVYAGFWEKRNELLLAQHMGPREYSFLYRLLYDTWLGHDPLDGSLAPTMDGKRSRRADGIPAPLPAPVWRGDPAALDSALADVRPELEANYSPLLNRLETMFEGAGAD